MFTYRISVLFFVFGLLLAASLVDARPVRNRRRSTCRPRPSTVPPSATIGLASTPSAVKIADSGDDVPDVPKAAPTTTATTPSTKPTSAPKSDDNDDDDDKDDAPSSSKAPSSTTSSSKPAATSSEPAPSPPKELSNNGLFPVNGFSKSWTTNPSAPNSLSLSDSTLRPTRLISSLSHDYVSAPDGKKGMRAVFPKGSYTFTHQPQGGLSFYGLGPQDFGLNNAKEITLGYRVFFEKGFAFNKGGKLPGVYGGNSDDEAVGCSGGRRSGACFSARMMWRSGGAGEFYTYLPPYTESKFSANRKQCNVAPESDCNPTYGASIGRGSFHFKDGQWNTVAERVKLNDVGQANGELELFVDGKSVVSVKGLILRDSSAGRFRGIQMQTFFGGSQASWGSPKNQNIWFSDFSMAILETL